MSVPAATTSNEDQLERAWWLRVLAVLLAPSGVFAALRNDSDESVHARQEPIAAVVGLAGVAGVLQTSVARHVLNEPGTSNIVGAARTDSGSGRSSSAAYCSSSIAGPSPTLPAITATRHSPLAPAASVRRATW